MFIDRQTSPQNACGWLWDAIFLSVFAQTLWAICKVLRRPAVRCTYTAVMVGLSPYMLL